jgi:hypothetical protein
MLLLRQRGGCSPGQPGKEGDRDEGGECGFHSDTPWLVVTINW